MLTLLNMPSTYFTGKNAQNGEWDKDYCLALMVDSHSLLELTAEDLSKYYQRHEKRH